MRAVLFLSAASAILVAAPAAAQQADVSVSSYLCQFAGKCDGGTEVAPIKAGPATKGFHLAAPQTSASPATVAPATKGFRLSSPAAAERVPVGARANLMLNFESNSDHMTLAAEGNAKVFAQAMMSPELKDKRFLIEGHTASEGTRDLNVDLARRQAQSVANFLVAQGVDASRVEVRGVGPDGPLPGRSAAAEANRRVEAVLLS